MKRLPVIFVALVLMALATVATVYGGAVITTAPTSATSATSSEKTSQNVALNSNQMKTSDQKNTDPVGVAGLPISRPGQIPAFTANDVRAFFHKYPFNGQADDSKIIRILFIPSWQAAQLMKGEETGLANPNALVCYVEFQGPFVLYDVSKPMGASPPVIQIGQVVFDASNGYVLVFGGI